MTPRYRFDSESATKLRDLLRDADPAREAAELSPEEAGEIRRTTLAATESSRTRPSPLLRPLLVAAVLASILLGGAWLFWPRPTPGPYDLRATIEPTPPPTEALLPRPTRQRAEAEPSPPEPPALPASAETPRVLAGAADEEPSPVFPADPATDHETTATTETLVAREIRFETDGGTRLIWIFQDQPEHDIEQGVTG